MDKTKNKIHSFIGDAGAYDSNENFRFLKDCNIQPIIKVQEIQLFHLETTRLETKKLDSKQEIVSNGKRRKNMDTGGW